MSPYKHAQESAKRWGGTWRSYIEIHRFLDSTKTHTIDNSHRMILHNTFGIEICERIFGDIITTADGKNVEVRYIVIEHIKEDLGFVPTVDQWCKEINKKPWMTGNFQRKTILQGNIFDLGNEETENK